MKPGDVKAVGSREAEKGQMRKIRQGDLQDGRTWYKGWTGWSWEAQVHPAQHKWETEEGLAAQDFSHRGIT